MASKSEPIYNLRWRYVWRGIWLYRSRTLLIILSSAIGIFAFGLIIGAAVTLRNMTSSFAP